MLKRSRLYLAVATATAGGIVVAPEVWAQELERVEITGSSIKRTQAEGPVPVEIVTRKQIERTGASTINELLKSLSTIDIFDQGELTSNSPAGSGTAQITMRGLSETNVLVLLNGRRLPVNALYDSSGAGAAVDVNTIPLSAIERVEILKDGGSAIYGADAVAGVVNFITRKNYTGVTLNAGYGISQEGDGEEKKAGLGAGFGDFDANGYNLFVGLDIFKRKPIYRKDRDISRSADFTRFGGPDARSGFSPYGNYIDDDGVPTGETVRPCPPELVGGGRCRYDFNADLLTAYNGADRVSALVLGRAKVANDLEGFAQAIYSKSKDTFDAHPVPDIFTAPDGRQYFGRFMQGGPRITNRESSLYQLSAGLEGSVGAYEWKVDAGQGRSKVTNDDRNYFNANTYLEETTPGLDGLVRIDPTVDTNDPAIVESMRVRPRRVGISKNTFVNALVRGDVTQLPAGPLAFAVGTSWWKESLTDTPDVLSQRGEVVGGIQQAAVSASRTAYAVFGELNIPIVKDLEAQVAARYDHYPTASRTSPKVALRYAVSPLLTARASYTESFRMPSLKQLYGAREEGAGDFTSEPLCLALGQPADCTVTGFEVNGSNRDLQPERGKTYNLGLVFEPGGGFSGSVDLWQIKIKNQIDTPTIDQAAEQGRFGRDANGRILVFTDLQNFAKTKVAGIDLDLEQRFAPLAFGRLTLQNTTTYYLTQKQKRGDAQPWEDFNGIYIARAAAKWRNTFEASLETGAWINTVSLRSTAGFYDTDEPDPEPGTRKVSSHHEVDFVTSYSGFRNWRLDAGIKNLFDKMPPFSYQNAVSNQYSQMGFAEAYSSRGRFFFVGATYEF